MTMTKADVENVSFAIAKKGYDVDEVDVFLEKVAEEIEQMTQTIARLKSQNESSPTENTEQAVIGVHSSDVAISNVDDLDDDARAIIAKKDETIEELKEQLGEKQADDSAISQALIVAQRSADDIIAKANSKADSTIQDAHDEADKIINRAEEEKSHIMASIAKLEEQREGSRSGYAEMLRDFIEDANEKLLKLGIDDDVSAIPFDELNESGQEVDDKLEEDNDESEENQSSVIEKDTSGFGDLSDEDDDLD